MIDFSGIRNTENRAIELDKRRFALPIIGAAGAVAMMAVAFSSSGSAYFRCRGRCWLQFPALAIDRLDNLDTDC